MNLLKVGFYSSLISIIGSIGIYAFYDHDLGIFVGLWASALLLLTERYEVMKI